jgi:hypothetical protein
MGLRKWAIAALVVLVMLVAATPAAAWKASEIRADIGDMRFGLEWVLQRPSATLFHTENLATTDNEALAIAFPVDASGQTVAPAIAQTAAGTAAASETGFFKANWCYTALVNPGGYDLIGDINTWHPMRSSHMVGSGITWPYMTAPVEGGNTMQFRPAINTAPDTANTSLQVPAVGAGNSTFTGGNLTSNATTRKVSQPAVGAGATIGPSATPNRDYKNMTAVSIRNMTGLEKMYRNANLRNTIPQTHQGSVARPEDIDPLKQPMDIIKPPNKPQVIADALNMTHEGRDLKTLFWDL